MEINKYGTVIENADLTNYNTYGIHTIAKYLICPNDIDSLQKIIVELNSNNIKYMVLGGGSNIILPDNPFNGAIISLEKLNDIKINDTIVEAEAGVNLGTLITECISNSLGGLENLFVIPGTLGGTLYGNAGANNACIYDYLESVTVLRDNKFITITKKNITYSYRNSMFKGTSDIIVKGVFKLYKEDANKLKEIMKENTAKRIKSQPLDYKNAGSVFKNPEGDYAGRLIESVGLKGYTVGGAQVSEKHANFIINIGNATGVDIRELIKIIQDKVYKETKIKLELEQNIIEWE